MPNGADGFEQMVNILKQSPEWWRYEDKIEEMRQRDQERRARREEEARAAREAEQAQREKQHQENVQLVKKLQRHKRTKATSMPGTNRKIRSARPVRTVKQKKEDLHKGRMAMGLNKHADYVSMHMQDSLTKIIAQRKNMEALYSDEFQRPAEAMDEYAPSVKAVPFSFLRGFADKSSKAAEADREFFRDFTADDTKRRWRHLDRMVDELINTKLHPEMLSGPYLSKYSGEYMLLSEHVADMRKLMSSRGNQGFFDGLDEKRKEKLKKAVDPNGPYALFAKAYTTAVEARGVNIRTGELSLDNAYGKDERTELSWRVDQFQEAVRQQKK